jgi:hypothetical protein
VHACASELGWLLLSELGLELPFVVSDQGLRPKL